MNAKTLTVHDLQQLTEDQLLSLNKIIVFAIKQKRAVRVEESKATMRVGQQVRWTSTRTGNPMTGTVVKIKRKMIEVQTTGMGLWNVAATLLKTV